MEFMRPSFQRRARRTGISFRYYWMGSFFISDEMTSQNKREALSSDFFVWPNQVNLAEVILDFYLKYILLRCNFQNAAGIAGMYLRQIFVWIPLFREFYPKKSAKQILFSTAQYMKRAFVSNEKI